MIEENKKINYKCILGSIINNIMLKLYLLLSCSKISQIL